MLARRALLVLVAVAAVTAIFAGLARVGVGVPGASLVLDHGPLFVLGVFGAVISLERAVALQRDLALVVPGLAVAGSVLLLLGARPPAQLAFACSSLGMVAINVVIVRKQAHLFTVLMLLASLALVASAALWLLGRAVADLVPAWIAFFVLTIVAERLELSRLVRTPPVATGALAVFAAALLGFSLAAPFSPDANRFLGAPLALLGAWELRFDIARRTIRTAGLPRFAAVGVLLGSAWLVVAGVLRLALGAAAAGPLADAVNHAVLVGFVLGMVFAHAPIILPSVAKLAVPFHPLLYVAVVTLHASLALRVVGDVSLQHSLRMAGSMGNALALVVFAGGVVLARALRLRAAPSAQG